MTEQGFANAPIDSAHAFRAIMRAMARPGTIQPVEPALAAPPPLLPSAAAVLLTLCDFQTPVWIGPSLRGEKVTHYLRFHAGAPLAGSLQDAPFALMSAADVPARLSDVMAGTHEYPDRSATLIVQVSGFVPGAVELSGPGIPSPLSFGVAGLGPAFWTAMAENHARFPIGIDAIFCAPGMIAALPRSSTLRLRETV